MPATFEGDDMFTCLSMCVCACHCDLGRVIELWLESVSAWVNDSGIVGIGDWWH